MRHVTMTSTHEHRARSGGGKEKVGYRVALPTLYYQPRREGGEEKESPFTVGMLVADSGLEKTKGGKG